MPKSEEVYARPDDGPMIESKSILLLEDDVELTEALTAILEMQNYYVKVVHRGVDGLREIAALDFDVIICDMVMPGLPGDMFYLAVQKLKPHLCSRFLFITGHKGNPSVSSFLSKVNQPVLYKPLTLDSLLDEILNLLLRQEAA